MKLSLFVVFISISVLMLAYTDIAAAQGITGPPETLDDLKQLGIKTLNLIPSIFKGEIGKAWEEAKAIWSKMYQEFKVWWDANWAAKFNSTVNCWWLKIKTWLNQRVGIFEQEFPRERDELKKSIKQEIPQIKQDLIKKFKQIWGE